MAIDSMGNVPRRRVPQNEGGQAVEHQASPLFSEDLASLLPFAKKIAKTPSYREEEIEAMALEAERTIDTLWNDREQPDVSLYDRLLHAESLESIIGTEQEFLLSEGIVNSADVQKLHELIETRNALAGSEIPKARKYFDLLTQQIDYSFHGLQERILSNKDFLITQATGQANQLSDRLKELLDIPRVKAKLDEWQKEGEEVRLKKIQEAVRPSQAPEGESEKQHIRDREAMRGIEQRIQIVQARHTATWEKILAVLPEHVHDSIVQLRSGSVSPRQESSIIDACREKLIRAILFGVDSARLNSPTDIVPWLMQSKAEKRGGKEGTLYLVVFDALMNSKRSGALKRRIEAGSVQAQKYLSAVKEIDRENAIFRRIFGNAQVKVGNSAKKERGQFLKAFDQRGEWEKTGMAEEERLRDIKRQEERQEKGRGKRGDEMREHIELKKNIARISAEGTGFEVAVQGKKGAVLLSKITKDEKTLWDVVECVGASGGHVKIGAKFTADLSNAPQWLREAARDKNLI